MKSDLRNQSKNLSLTALSVMMLLAALVLSACEGASSGPPGLKRSVTPAGGPPGPSAAKSVPMGPVASKKAASGPAIKKESPMKPPGLSANNAAGDKPADKAVAPSGADKQELDKTEPVSATADASKTEPKAGPDVNPADKPAVAKMEQLGIQVLLASEIVTAGANPFFNRLPRIHNSASSASGGTGGSGGPGAELPPPPDPFSSVRLMGIVYNAKNPIALFGITGGENQSELLRKGDVLFVDGGQIKVVDIRKDRVTLQQTGVANSKRTFELPDIVGYSGGNTHSAPKSEPPSSSSIIKLPGGGSQDARRALENILNTGSPDGVPKIQLQEP